MKIIRVTLLLCALFQPGMALFGQTAPHVPGQFLVSLSPETVSPQTLAERFEADYPSIPIQIAGKVSDLLQIWLFQTPPGTSNERAVLAWLRRQPEVRLAQFNHLLENRSAPLGAIPNDPLFAQQWHHINTGSGGGLAGADMDSDLAWNITTGGLSPEGDTIVVAVIDVGLDDSHEDLAGNVWRNTAEIPGDNIDNDLNGYVDDFRGWSAFLQNDQISSSATTHGTPVSAIIGARGNNGLGVVGVNWNIKIMFVAGNNPESVILSAYDYVWKSRKRYNASQGKQGAFVVAINCSWGVTYGQPADAPLWCAAFDSLGSAGILTVAATANTPLDVDIAGDLPTACPSDYLITVTSLTKTDQKASDAAWGAQSIDLGAYGKNVVTAAAGNQYATFDGTSFAAPQVSGAIGLLYSAPCSNLAAIAKASPATAALKAKQVILSSATPNASLQGKTLTGGRLNLFNMLQQYQSECVSCLSPLALTAEAAGGNQLKLMWSKTADVTAVRLRWRLYGDSIWNLQPMATSPFVLSGLKTCAEYEISLQSTCNNSLQSAWSVPLVFRTGDCCEAPASIGAITISDTSASITWSSPAVAQGYRLRWRVSGGVWQDLQAPANYIELNGLTPCTDYELTIQTQCGPDSLSASNSYIFKTAGCGPCTDMAYCPAKSHSANDEWIKTVEIGPWKHYSGGNAGYQDFTGNPDILAILPGSDSIPILLIPGYSGLPYPEYFRVYIDYNGDGDFDDPDDLAFDAGYSTTDSLAGKIKPPVFSTKGLSRMRVLMKYKGPAGSSPTPCETFDFGQVEDYCVLLGSVIGTESLIDNRERVSAFPQPARDRVFVRVPGAGANPVQWCLFDATGRMLEQGNAGAGPEPVEISVSGLPGGWYVVRLQTRERVFQQKILVVR